MTYVTVRGSMSAGRFVGVAVARRLRDFIHVQGLDGEVEWDPGWPMGSVRFSVTGTEDEVDECIAAIKRWAP
jgi:hypothetical protein